MLAESLIPLVALLHIVGAGIGTVFTTYAEIFYLKAVEDDKIDHRERKYLRHLFRGIQLGAFILIITGSTLMVLEYLVSDAPQAVVQAPFWGIQTLTLVIVLFGYELSRRNATWWIASAAIGTAWWMILLADLGIFNTVSYVVFMFIYVIATAIVAAALWYTRLWTWKPRMQVAE